MKKPLPIVRGHCLALLAGLLLACLPLAAQAEAAGRVIMTIGAVTAVDADGGERAISRHDVVYAGETLRTGSPRGRAQVRFRDEGLVDLRAGTEFAIESYEEPAAEDEGGSAVMNLLRGALRKVTGRIGRREQDEYRMNTPTATVGVRGTDYSLEYCDADCAGDGREAGVYGRVHDGTVVVSNDHGTGEFDDGDYFFVPADGPPELLLMPPDGVLDDTTEAAPSGDDLEIELAVVPVIDGEPLDFGIEPLFEAGDVLADDLFEDPDQDFEVPTLVAGGFAGMIGPQPTLQVPDRDLGVANADQGEVVFDQDGQPVAIDINGRSFDFADASPTPGGSTQGVDWGAWVASPVRETTFEVDGELVGDGGFVWAVTDNITSPGRLAALDGTRSMSLDIEGPSLAYTTSGATEDIRRFDITVDLSDLVADIDRIEFELQGTHETIFTDGELTFDAETVTLSGRNIAGTITDEGGTLMAAFADFEGFLIGEDAGGSVIGFAIDRSDAGQEDLAGTVILTE